MLDRVLRVIQNYGRAQRGYKSSPLELQRLTSSLLSNISSHAYTHSVYYRQLFDECGLSGSIGSLAQLEKLPVIGRKNVVEACERMACSPLTGDLTWRQTSGTSGSPLRIPWSREQLDAVIGVRMRFSRQMGLKPWSGMVWLHYKGKHCYHNRCEDFYEAYGKRSPSVLWVNPSKLPSFGEKLDSLNEFKPDLVASWPSDLARVGRVLKEQGRPISVRRIRPMGEMLTKRRRAELADLWCSEVFEAYGTSEFGLLATECPDHHGLHLNSDSYIFEVLSGDGDTSPDGEGELFVTSLHNTILPLFRYNTRDLVTLAPQEKCSCGTYFPLITDFLGRAQDGLLSHSGRRVSPGRVMHEIESVLGCMEYHLTQTSVNELILAIPGGFLEEGLLTGVREGLSTIIGDVKLRVTEFQEQIGQKQRRVISNI